MNRNFEALHKLVETKEANICEITVMKGEEILYEDFWNGFMKGDALNVMSVTKSIMSLLTGIAIDQGAIHSVDDFVLSYFPDYKPKGNDQTIRQVTIRHLLTMTAPYKYWTEPWKKVFTSDDWTRAALDLLGGRKITGRFKYATLGLQILSGIIENATGRKLIDFANEYLFAPLGIERLAGHEPVSREDQMNYITSTEPRGREWFLDPKGCATAGWGILLSATDLAKIGVCVLRGGIYQGKRLFSESYVKEMSTPYLHLGRQFGYMSYGYLWWIPHKDSQTIAAIGDGGNVIYVNPEKQIVVGVASTLKPRVFDRVDFIENVIIKQLSDMIG